MGYHSLLDLSNHARAATAVGDAHTTAEALSVIESRLQLPRHCIETELHGRKAVDALLNLALAGCCDSWMFAELSEHAVAEVRRWGHRKSCTSMTLAQLVERAAAAGCCGPLPLFDVVGDILAERGEASYTAVTEALNLGAYSLEVSDSAARWVYRASTRMSKESAADANAFAAPDWGVGALAFDDTTRPLTIE